MEGGYFSGTIYAKDGVFSGEIRSSKGKIGGWTIAANGLSNGNVHIYSTKYVHDDEDFSDGSPETVIYLEYQTGTVRASEVYGYLHDLWAYTGEYPHCDEDRKNRGRRAPMDTLHHKGRGWHHKERAKIGGGIRWQMRS